METLAPYIETPAVKLYSLSEKEKHKSYKNGKSPHVLTTDNYVDNDPYFNIKTESLEKIATREFDLSRKARSALTKELFERANENKEVDESMLLRFLELYDKQQHSRERIEQLEKQYQYAGNARTYLINRELTNEGLFTIDYHR